MKLSAADRLASFARLYGYLRFFHPGDEAASIDWSKYAVVGVAHVLRPGAPLRQSLEEWMRPIAPTASIYAVGEKPPPPHAALEPVEGSELVAWQHLGLELDSGMWPYLSGRTARTRHREPGEEGRIEAVFDAADLRGKNVRWTARVAAEGDSTVELKIAVRDADDRVVEETTEPVTDGALAEAQLTIPIPEEANSIAVSITLSGSGRAEIEGAELAVGTDAGWREVERLQDYEGRFFYPDEGRWERGGKAYEVELSQSPDFFATIRAWADPPFFGPLPEAGEVLQRELGAGLMLQLPVALQSVDGHTLPVAQYDLVEAEADEREKRLATVVVAWNVLQHAYPYFDVVDADWSATLTESLAAVLEASDREAYRRARDEMLIPLCDGHAQFYDRGWSGIAPVSLARVESEIVVVASASDVDIPCGVRVVEWGGRPVEEVYDEAFARKSGTERYRSYASLRNLCRGEWQESFEITYLVDDVIERRELCFDQHDFAKRFDHGDVTELEPATWYVNGMAITLETLEARAAELATADAIVIDLRGYPSQHALELLGHLTEEPLWCGLWNVPQLIYPDQERLVGYSKEGRWQVEPRAPHFGAEVAFLTGPAAISYGETVMGIVEHYRLGTVVGEATAGTNGNINRAKMPDGSMLIFTGMRVLKHDETALHGVGIEPHVAVEPTLEGLRAGRDEVLKAALEALGAGPREVVE